MTRAERDETAGDPRCSILADGSAPPDANLVLIVNDSMRRDAAGAYGGSARTPFFDEFARDHILFRNAVSQSPWTKPSIATLFTSLYPSQHGCTSHPAGERKDGAVLEADRLAEELVTLAEVLRDSGRETAAFVSNPWMESGFGFSQGFEVYDDASTWDETPPAELTAKALAWLSARDSERPFFLYVHYIASHRPYGQVSREEFESKREALLADDRPLGRDAPALMRILRLDDGERMSDALARPTLAAVELAYDSGVESFDVELGALLAALREQPGWDRTAVVVTSDHGEALYARGYGNHGLGLYDDEAAVPLVARLPGLTGAREIDCLVGLLDVMPSLCSYLDLACPETMAGWSFVGGDTGGDDVRYLVTEGLTTATEHRSVRNQRFKLMYEPLGQRDGRSKGDPWSLFNLATDPNEMRDLLVTAPEAEGTRRALARLQAMLPQVVPPFETPAPETRDIDPALEERLRELGYLKDERG